MSTRDELAGVLADTINKQFKDMKVAYFLDGSDTTPTDVKDFISTGSTMLDLAISNRPDGGIAVGRITELNGLESSGKSLIGAHILAETQKKGGVAVYIDTETAVSTEFLEAIGVDINQMLYLHLETVEDIFGAIEEIVAKVRESDKDRLVTILVDSLAAATTKVELEAEFDKDGWATSKAIILSKAMRVDWKTEDSSRIYKSTQTKTWCDVWRSLDYKWWKSITISRINSYQIKKCWSNQRQEKQYHRNEDESSSH